MEWRRLELIYGTTLVYIADNQCSSILQQRVYQMK